MIKNYSQYIMKEEINTLSQEIKNVSDYFENGPCTGSIKSLKEDFNIDLVNAPNYYLNVINKIEELLRETRILFLYSVFNKVCKEENKLYHFDTPFQAEMRYDAIVRKEGFFYLLDEDGEYREIFTSERFTQFIDELYWELYEND